MKINNPLRQKDLDRRKRSSNIFKSKEVSEKVINSRLKIFIGLLCLVFLVITFRLVQIQILEHDEYELKLQSFTSTQQTISAPRGTIYDASGKVLAESVKSLTISYYPSKGTSDADEWNLAQKFVDEVGVNDLSITDRQLKDMYISYMSSVQNDDLSSLLTKKQIEKANNGELSVDDVYDLKLEKIDVNTISDNLKKVLQVKMLMDKIPDNEFKTIIEDATEEQIAYVTEHSSTLTGFTGTFDWKREYYYTDEVKSLIGSISNRTQGLPSENSDYYQALGYAMNDRVGISGLEKQYEQLLAGTKSKYSIAYDENGNAYLNQEEEGKSGYDITLTLNIDYQKKIDEIIKSTMESNASNSLRQYWDNTYFVAINIKTGGIIAMDAVKKDSDGNLYSDPTATYLEADRVGSCVKMATLYMGLNEKVVSEGEVIVDGPMYIKGTDPIASYHNYGAINDIKAIGVSSNVYMWNIAIRLGGSSYVANAPLSVNDNTFDLMRSYYNMFGLGVKTGIDMPDEQVGSIGGTDEKGKILHLAIGQYDTYTSMQLAQYISTIANGGYRLQTHLLNYASEVNDRSTIVYKFATNTLSTLLGNKNLLSDPKQGMRMCVTENFCEGVVDTNGVEVAAKSGTADNEIYINGQQIQTTNATMGAFAPYDDPEVAFVCLTPNSNNGFGGSLQSNISGKILSQAITEYFANYRQK